MDVNYAVNKNRHNRFGSTHDYLYFITRSFNFSLLRDVHTPFLCDSKDKAEGIKCNVPRLTRDKSLSTRVCMLNMGLRV